MFYKLEAQGISFLKQKLISLLIPACKGCKHYMFLINDNITEGYCCLKKDRVDACSCCNKFEMSDFRKRMIPELKLQIASIIGSDRVNKFINKNIDSELRKKINIRNL